MALRYLYLKHEVEFQHLFTIIDPTIGDAGRIRSDILRWCREHLTGEQPRFRLIAFSFFLDTEADAVLFKLRWM